MATSANHKLIVLAREYRGKTQSQLAKEIPGLTQGNLSRIEKGILGITDEVINKISENLNFPKEFFYGEHVKTPITDFYYRKRITIPKKTLSKIEAKFDIYRIVIDKLLDALEVPEFSIPSFNLEKGGTPEDSARKVRQYLNIGNGPINNIISIFERAGIIVVPFDSETDKFDGITTFTDAGQPVIFLNDNKPNDRKRFTLGHELGHLIMHIPFSPLSNERDEENEANRFSSEFNMPHIEARKELYSLRFSDLTHMKRYWKMSMAFIIMRAKTTSAITHARAKNLMIELSRRGYRKKEPVNVDIDSPKVLKQMIDVHLNQLGYTKSELAEMLNLDMNELNNLLGNDKKIIRLRIV